METCPICKSEIKVVHYYPNSVCSQCAYQTKTKQGQVIQFKNKSYYGGFISIIDTIIGNERECYINDVPCLAQIHQGEIIIVTIH